jgi:hypothetical protein
MPKLVLTLLILAAAQPCAGADEVVLPDLSEVMIADLKDWRGAIAFYVDAPASVRKKMSEAVGQARESTNSLCASLKETHWFCSGGKFRYLRGVTGVGGKSKSGFVCTDEPWISHQRYYPERMLIEDGCIEIAWDDVGERYEVRWWPDDEQSASTGADFQPGGVPLRGGR